MAVKTQDDQTTLTPFQEDVARLPSLRKQCLELAAKVREVAARVDAGESPERALRIAQQNLTNAQRQVNRLSNTAYARALENASPQDRREIYMEERRRRELSEVCAKQCTELEELERRRRLKRRELEESGPGWERAGDVELLKRVRADLAELDLVIDDVEQLVAETTSKLAEVDRHLTAMKREMCGLGM